MLALANQAALGEGPLNLSNGAKVALNFTGQSYVTQLTLGGSVQAAGTYGSSDSSATHKNDTWFSGTGVIHVSATIDHVAMATSNLQAADTAWAAGNWAAVRTTLSNVFNNLRLDAQWRSIAHLRYARSFQVAGDYPAASAVFDTIAGITEYPKIHQIEGAECKTECDRLALALPGRDPETNRVRVTAAPAPGRMLYVSPNGNDANPGTLGQPFATVNQALAANRAAGPVAGGTAIELAAGRYPLASTISLTSTDSGSGPDAPLSIRATTPGTAVISGSKRLTGFTAVTNTSILARLPAEAQGKVMQCSLTALGITDYGSIQEQPMVNLSVNGVPQNLARWPNSGFIRIGGMVDGGNIDHNNPSLNRPQIFTWSSDRPSRWTTAPDAWIQGYLATNWLYGSVAIGSINPQARTITTAWTYNRLSGWPDISSGNPYSVFNLLEEIDEPGEWYLDRTNGMLYWYPSADPSTAVVDFSMLSGSMLTVNAASHVRIEGLVFENSRGTGVELQNSSNCLIAGCTVRNLSGIGVSISGGQQNSMIGCDLHDLEQGACHLSGGDGNTLTPGNHVLANCRFRNFGRINRSAGISLNGVGHRITHCVFEDCPSSAIGFGGFNFLVEYNEFRNCCNEIDDYGVIYAWGNPTWRGNIWRFNKFSHCGGGYTQGWLQNRFFGTSAFRFDDAVSGQTVYGNVFTHFDLWGQSAGVMGNNSGRDNIYDNNLVTDSRGLNYGYYDGSNHRYLGGLPNGLTSAQLAAFPELVNLYDGNGQNYLWRSTTLRVSAPGINAGNSSYADNEWGGWQYIANTNTGSDPGFVEGVEFKKTMAPSLFWNLGMRAIPVDEIGLYQDSTRAGWIDNPGMAYWNGSSGNWDASTANWSTSTTTPASMAWNDNGDTTAVFTGAGGTITLAAPLSANGLIFTAPGYTLAGTQPIVLNGPLTTLDVKNFGATLSAPLIGLGGISVAGPGTLTLSGANSFNGTTTVESGTLALSGGDNCLPTCTVVTLGGGGPAAIGTLKLNGCSQELAGLWTADYDNGASAGNRVINGSATPCTLTLNTEHTRNNQFVGTLGGPGQNENNFAVKKTGGGGLWLRRSITWTGGTTIEEGTLELNSSWWQNNEAYGSFRIGKGATFAVSGRVSPLYFKGVTVEFLSAGDGTLIHRGSPDWLDWRAEWGLTIRSTGGKRNQFSSAANDYINLVDGGNFDIARGSDATCDLLVSIPLVGNGSITKQGNGIMTLSGGNSYSGATVVNAGTLVVDGSTAAASAVTVASGASLGGSGWIGGAITVPGGATLAPGTAVGTLTAGSSVTLGGRLAIEIDGTTNDRLAVAGGLNISGATLGITVRAGGTGRSEYVLATFENLVGSAFTAVEGLPDGYRLEYDLTGKQIRLVKINVGMTATSVAGGVFLTWSSPEVGATSFTVRRATTSGGPYTMIATDIAGTQYLDSAVVNGGTYYYTVQSNLGAYSDEASALFSVAVRNLAAAPGYNTVGLSWTPVDTGTVSYTIHRATSPGGAHTIIASGITATSYADNTAANGTTYHYSVQSQSGAVSGEVSATPIGVVGALPPPWAQADVGTVGQAGNATYTSGLFTSAGAGGGATSTADAFRFVYLPVVGDCTIVAHVDSLGTGGTTSRRAGVMIRQSLNANAIEAATLLGPTAVYHTRRTTVGSTTNSSTSNTTPPRWVRLIRSGNTLTAAHSANGTTWTSLTARTVTMSGTVYVGLVVSSGNTTALNTAAFSNVSITGGYPVGLSATASDRSVQLAWTAVTGAASYTVKRSTTHGGPYTTVGTATGTSYADTTAQNSTTYYYVVSAVSGAGESVNSAQIAATPGRIPANGIWANVSGGNWSASANWLGGLIAGDIDKSATFNLPGGGTINQDSADLTIGGLVFATGNYTITGNSLTLDVSSGQPLVSVETARAATIAAALSGTDGLAKTGAGTLTLSAANNYIGTTTVSSGTLIVGASGTLGAGDLLVASGAVCDLRNTVGAATDTADVYLTGSGRLMLAAGVAETVKRFYIGGVLQPAGTYTAANLPGSISGGGSLVVTVGKPTVPTGLTATAGGGQVALSWNLVTGATGYIVRRSTVSGSDYTVVGSPTEPAFNDSGLVSGITCYYIISAVNADGESPASTEVSATPLVLTGDGVWTRLKDGVWSPSGNWQNSVIAAGVGKKATFAQTTGVTVTLDGARTLGTLDFANANYTLAGSGALTLDAGVDLPAVSVAAGSASSISVPLAGTTGFAKTGTGTLILSGANSYTGGTMINGGTLISGAGGVAKGAVTLASGATLSTTSAGSTGLAALYYNHSGNQANIASLPALLNHFGANTTAPSLVQTAPSMNFAGNGSGFPAPYNSSATGFEAFYSGKVNITTAGNYTFNTSSDDGSMLFIDGQAVVTNNFDQPVTTRSGTIFLAAGMHDIVIAYNQGGGGYGMNAQISGAGNTTMVDINTSNANITPDLIVGSLAGAGNVALTTGNLITGIDNSSTNFSGVISGIGSLTKFGTGVQTLTGANTYNGNTTVNGGTLRLGNGSSSTHLADSANVVVATGAMLHLDFTGTDQINALWLDGLQLPPGVYSSSSGFITGTGTLTVTSGLLSTDYATWSGRGLHDLSGGPAADDDNDSIANLLEYVLGGDPCATSSGILPAATASAGNLVFTFRRIHSTISDTTQVFQYGTNLTGWSDVPVVAGGMVAIQPNTPQAGTDTVTITVPEGTEPRIFGRLKVSVAPARP